MGSLGFSRYNMLSVNTDNLLFSFLIWMPLIKKKLNFLFNHKLDKIGINAVSFVWLCQISVVVRGSSLAVAQEP